MTSIPFALNHIATPALPPEAFFSLASSIGIHLVEIRNDLSGNAILDGTPAAQIRRSAGSAGVEIISINALQRFNDWNAARAAEAGALIAYARDCGARALVLVPVNDGTGQAEGERQANLREALAALKPMLQAAGIVGLVEPLGFDICSLRLKSEAAAAIRSVEGTGLFKLVHDTFHHHLAGEAAVFADLTGLVHISGVADADVPVKDMRDSHRVLVDAMDRLDNIGQIRTLRAAGYSGPFSFEPFSAEVQTLADPGSALRASMEHLRDRA
jgi:2-keto-myo-inositol isomerase